MASPRRNLEALELARFAHGVDCGTSYLLDIALRLVSTRNTRHARHAGELIGDFAGNRIVGLLPNENEILRTVTTG